VATLDKDGPKDFISYACSKATSVPRGRYHKQPIRGHPAPNIVVSFHDCVYLLDKYTNRRGSKVHLDAEILETEDPDIHNFQVSGIKDLGIRKGRSSTLLERSQYGEWFCCLEDALSKGIPAVRIRELRRSLRLREDCGERHFFDIL
jgi:hypothetical protein